MASESEENFNFNFIETWIVPQHEVINAGPGRDNIPPIDYPKFTEASDVTFLQPDRHIFGIKIHDEIYAFPHQIMDWHEIVNLNVNGQHFAITYSPLSGTAVSWKIDRGTEFGTAGLIFRNNLVAYDRYSESLWSQMLLRSINGERMGETLQPLQVIETKWEIWEKTFPESQVLNTKTGFNRDYKSFAYGKEYLHTDALILFPSNNRTDTRLPEKTRVFTILEDSALSEKSAAKVYEINKFGDDVKAFQDEFEGDKIVVVGSQSLDFATAFHTIQKDGTELVFESVQEELPVIMNDQEGNKWNVFGEAVSGPRTGEILIPVKSYTGYWFAIRDVFFEPDIHSFSGN